MRYPYHDSDDSQFERLIVELCAWLLGEGVQGFSSGPDEGRDARFEGTAARFPSERDPLRGKFVIQAKHTESPVAKFSDSKFSGASASAILSEEIPRVKRLVGLGECDHYLLFSNRRLGGQAERQIRKRILDETGVSSTHLFGMDNIDDLVKRRPDSIDRAGLSELKMPLGVTPDDLAEVICALDEQRGSFAEASEAAPIVRTPFEEKNRINRLGDEFAKEIKRTYMREFDLVGRFLAHPENEAIKERYREAVAEFNEQILAHRSEEDAFEALLLNLQRLLWSRDSDLARHKRLAKLVIYYMYWMCDLGQDREEC